MGFRIQVWRYLVVQFGETRDQACGHCSFCLGDRARVLPHRTQTPPELLEKALAKVQDLKDEIKGKDVDSFTLTRFLCGISSPRLMRTKLSSEHPYFGILTDTSFELVLRNLQDRGFG